MKKQLSMVLFLTIVLTACSSGEKGETAKTDDSTSKGEKTSVTLSVQEPYPFYQTLKKKFEEKYPEINLQIQAYKQAGEQWSASDYEKYQQTTSTAILSGKGPDIFEIGSLPITDFVNKKLLLNMDDYINKDQSINKSDLEMNVLQAIKLNGGTYAIPSGYFLNTFVGDKNLLTQMKVDDNKWTWADFEEISRGIQKNNSKTPRYALSNFPPDALLQEILGDRFKEFVDRTGKKAKFDSPEFLSIMQQIKKMYDDNIMSSKPAENNNQLFYPMDFISPTDLINGPYSVFTNPQLLKRPHAGQKDGGIKIKLSQEFAIQANSPVKEEAWKFMSYLLSSEGQSLQEREGFSLLKSVNDKKVNDIKDQVKSGNFKLPNGMTASAPDEDFTRMKEMIHAATQFNELDGKIIRIVGEESRTFFSGQKPAGDVAKLIQNRVTTYINE